MEVKTMVKIIKTIVDTNRNLIGWKERRRNLVASQMK